MNMKRHTPHFAVKPLVPEDVYTDRAEFIEYFYHYQPLRDEPPLITGLDLIHVFGLTPSPLFRKILDLVDDAKLTKTIENRSEALELIKDVLKNDG